MRSAMNQIRPSRPAWSLWTAEEVKSRMISAMRVIERLPESGKMQRLRSAWPSDTYARDPSAIIAEQRAAETSVLVELGREEWKERYASQKLTRSPPHPREISNMEQALEWPGRYLDQKDSKILGRWAHEVASTGRSVFTAGALGVTKQGLNKRILRIASLVANGLKRDRVIPS
jgi:hypothetical protein